MRASRVHRRVLDWGRRGCVHWRRVMGGACKHRRAVRRWCRRVLDRGRRVLDRSRRVLDRSRRVSRGRCRWLMDYR
jgi:hypothetical protein